ncbi:MAG: hypothetical protein JO112_21065, partial [Planctomycetes bacterium]|nr:hypothetical protein [Planctomycetota bacterium]
MSFTSWLRGWKRSPIRPQATRAGARHSRPHAFGPVLEELEIRLTPSVPFLTMPGNLLVSESVYSGTAGTVMVGQPLPGGGNATVNGSYPGVWANEAQDGSFGVTSPILLQELTPTGTPVGNPLNLTSALGSNVTTSFSSKSELALNLSADGTAVTFMAYESPSNALDVSNSNTPGHIDPTNPVGAYPVNQGPTQRAVVQIDANGNLTVTPVNTYSGNNGRAAILGSNGLYYMTGNAGNGGNFTIKNVNTIMGSNGLTAPSTTGLEVGQPISGTGIPTGATVASIGSSTQFTISANATATGTITVTITQDGNTLGMLSNNTGVQMITPGAGGESTVVGQVQGTLGNTTGYQRGFSVAQTNPLTNQPYGPADKTGKDDNFRGLTIFNNTVYVTKGSGGNGIDTVYQVGSGGSLPTFANAGTQPISILPGLPTTLAKNIKTDDPATDFHPFGIWFANATTLYVADEGDGTGAANPNTGLEKWSLVNGTWVLDYTLKNGLNLGAKYSVPNGPNGEVYPSNLNPATDGLRNLAGRINGDGTVTLYAVTSTASANTDQGADPNQLVTITDNLAATTLPTSEQFTTLETATFGQVLRGVSFAPTVARPILSSVAIGNQSMVFALGSDQGIYQLNTRAGTSWTKISPANGPQFVQLSAGTDGNGQADVYAVTTAGALWKFDSQFAPSGFQVDGPGIVRQVSATQGNWAVVLGTDGQVYSYNGLGFGAGARYLMTFNSGTTFLAVSAGNDQAGRLGTFAITQANALVKVNPDGTTTKLSGSELIQQVSAGRDGQGNVDAFAVSTAGGLFKFDSLNGYFQADASGNALQVNATLAD